MSIKADCHLHSSFSGDSQAPMPEMIDKGLALGLETMCFTEHNDFDYPRTEEGPGTIFFTEYGFLSVRRAPLPCEI